MTVSNQAVSHVRDTTRQTWNALLEPGKPPPSVRSIHRVVHGSFTLLAAECKVLRGEDDGAAAASYDPQEPLPDTSAPEAEPDTSAPEPETDTPLTVEAAKNALEIARQSQARTVQAAQEAETAHTQAEEAVRALERQMLDGHLVEAKLIAARNARLLAHLRIADMRALVDEHEVLVAAASAAMVVATQRAELAVYNTLAAERAPLVAAVQDAVAQLEAALRPLLVHHDQQVAQAAQLGFADLLTATPFSAGPPDAGNVTSYALLNFWLHTHLATLVPAPSHDIDPRLRLRVADLAEVDVAFAHPLTWDQCMQVTANTARQVQVRLMANPTPEASNMVLLAEAGLPGVLSPLRPVVLPAAMVEVLRQGCPALQVVGEVLGE